MILTRTDNRCLKPNTRECFRIGEITVSLTSELDEAKQEFAELYGHCVQGRSTVDNILDIESGSKHVHF